LPFHIITDSVLPSVGLSLQGKATVNQKRWTLFARLESRLAAVTPDQLIGRGTPSVQALASVLKV
jgi:hypothetical protein